MATTKKAGDSLIPKKGEVIVAKDASGAVAVIHKGEQTSEQWGKHTKQAADSGHEVFKDGVRVEATPDASSAEKPLYRPKGNDVVAHNGATAQQVTEGGTPGTFKETPVADAISNAAQAAGTILPGTPDGPSVMYGNSSAAPKSIDSNTAMYGTPGTDKAAAQTFASALGAGTDAEVNAPLPGKPTSDEKKLKKEVASAGSGAGSAGGGAPAVPDENSMDRAFAVINKNHALANVAEEQAIAAHKLASAHTDMAITERQFADQQMQADQIQKQAEDNVQKHIDSIQAEQAKLDPTINRDRYWQNKSGGQIAAGALAAACFGFAGKGMDYLKMIQSEVDADVQAQQMTFDNKKGNLKEQRQGYESQFERAMKSGLSRKASIESARIAITSSNMAQVQAMTQQGLSDVGMANMQVIAQGLGGDILDAQAKAKFEGVRNGKELAAAHLMNAQAEAARAKARNAGKGGTLSKNAEKSIQEVDTATDNAKSELLKVRALIVKGGTVNLTGAEDKEINRALDFYSVYAAKVKDPNSIVSKTEAARERESLGVDTGASSMTTRNSVYLKVIDDTIARLAEQKAITRRNRGATTDASADPDAAVGGTEQDE